METSQLIEINGIKLEVDHRTATLRKVDTFKIGDPVKLLLKEYSGHEVKPGIIVAFDQFTKRPTITIAYLEHGNMKFAYLFNGCEHEIVPATKADLDLNKDYIVDRMQREIDKAEQDLVGLKAKKQFFIDTFGQVLINKTEENISSI